MKKVIKKHPLAIRWFHWINFPVIGVMIWSGILIYWANDIYKVKVGNTTIIKFFPDSFYKALHLPFRLAEGMSFHFVFMWLFAINGFIYVLYLIFSGEWKLIVPNKKSLKESFLVVLHDLHLRKKAPDQKKYNAAQRIAYTGVIVMGFGSLITGLSIYKPVQFHTLCALLGGYEWARAEHFILTILFTLFFVVHIVQVILAGWNNFRSMVTGLDVLSKRKKAVLQPVAISDEMPTKQLIVPINVPFKSETTNKENDTNIVNLTEENSLQRPDTPTENHKDQLPEDNDEPTQQEDTNKPKE